MGKKYKLNIFELLSKLDRRQLSVYEALADDERKEVSPYLLLRWMSIVKEDPDFEEFYTLIVNDVVNKGFWQLSKYPDLQLKLLGICGSGQKSYHQWLSEPKGSSRKKKNKVREIIEKHEHSINDDEWELIKLQNTKKDFRSILEQYGYQKSEITVLLRSMK